MAVEQDQIAEKAPESSGSGSSSNGDNPKTGRDETGAPEKLALEKADSKVAVAPKADDPDDLYKHLPPHQAEVLKRQVFTPEVKQGIAIIYRYSSRNDVIVLGVSAFCAIASGAALPLMTVIFGNLQNTFQSYFYSGGSMTEKDFQDELATYVLYFVYLAIVSSARTIY